MTKELNDPIMLIMVLLEKRLEAMHGYTLCFSNLMNMGGKRAVAIRDFDPTLGSKSVTGLRGVDIHGSDTEPFGLVFVDDASDILSGKVRGIGYVAGPGETQEDMYKEMVEDAYLWLIQGIHPDIPVLH